MKLLEGKIAIVTGGTRGIGRAIVEVFAKEGAKVIFTFKNSIKKAKEIEYNLSHYTKIKYYQSDVNNIKDIKYVVDETIKNFNHIDILVNNVGITRDNLLIRMNINDWEEVINTNLNSIFSFTQEVVKYMIRQRNGCIINISSIVGIKGNAGQSNYSAAKSGIIGFTKSIAKELGSRNIRCNVVAPGLIDTDMSSSISEKNIEKWINYISLKRIGHVSDVANACLFLASNLSDYITGEVINVNGGINY